MNTGIGAGPTADDRRFLMAVLLVSVARGDGSISQVESDKLIQLLCSRLRIRSAEALESLSAAVIAVADYQRVVPRLKNIAGNLSLEEKQDLLIMLLEVAAADGARHTEELGAINQASELLGMSREAVHAAFDSYFSSS